MTLETFGTGEENYFDSLNTLIQDVEKTETPKTILESLIDDAINRNQEKNDSIFIKELTKEQREIVSIKSLELLQSLFGKQASFNKTDKLRITTDQEGLYIRIYRNKEHGPRFIPFSEIPKPKSHVMKTGEELVDESTKSIEAAITEEMDNAFEYNKNISEDFRKTEKKEHDRLYPLSGEVSEKNKESLKKEMINLWITYSSYHDFEPNKYHIEITTDHPKQETLYVRLRHTKTKKVIGGGAKLFER